MVDHAPYPAWPHMPIDEAITALAKVRDLPVTEITNLVSTDVEGRIFYATAPTRVDKKRLDELRESVLTLATRHGFPGQRDKRASPTFDQELAVLFSRDVPMLPVEASDEEVWAFITLRVLPDVAAWRWPAKDGDPDRTQDESDGDRSDSRTDRLLGTRRGVFRQAWWRGFLLGPDACLLLDEDNFINLTDRVSLTGYGAVRDLVVSAHLGRVADDTYDRRYALRRALILIGREFGRLAVEALPPATVAEIVESAFEQATRDTAKPRDAMGGPGMEEPERDAGSGPASSASVVERFLAATAPYRSVLEPSLKAVDRVAIRVLVDEAAHHVQTLGRPPLAVRIHADLSGLADEWPSLTGDERSVVYSALCYFVEHGDLLADGDPGGLVDDDEVVGHLFAALGRDRPQQ